MNEAVAQIAVHAIAERIGVHVTAKLTAGDAPSLDIVPADAHPNDSFVVRFSPGWRAAEAEFIPGRYAAPMISQMGAAGPDCRSALVAFASALTCARPA